MNVTVTMPTDLSEDAWGSDPNARFYLKRQIAEQIGRALQTREHINWSWKTGADGRLEVTGSIDLQIEPAKT